jgi:hypothetical protein
MMSELKCDFCREFLEDDEELSPLFIGEEPEPEGVTSRVFVEEIELFARWGEVPLRQPIDVSNGIIKAIESSNNLDFEVRRFVEGPFDCWSSSNISNFLDDFEVEKVSDRLGAGMGVQEDVNLQEYEDVIAVRVEATPEKDKREPDIEVCEYCREKFEELP